MKDKQKYVNGNELLYPASKNTSDASRRVYYQLRLVKPRSYERSKKYAGL
jgi:hypothetical protein